MKCEDIATTVGFHPLLGGAVCVDSTVDAVD